MDFNPSLSNHTMYLEAQRLEPSNGRVVHHNLFSRNGQDILLHNPDLERGTPSFFVSTTLE